MRLTIIRHTPTKDEFLQSVPNYSKCREVSDAIEDLRGSLSNELMDALKRWPHRARVEMQDGVLEYTVIR